MDSTVQSLVDRLWQKHENVAAGQRVLVGLCGVPGSGKSQLALHVIEQLNSKAGEEIGIVVGMDGWHYTRAQLAAMPDPQLARDKRGAAWTFDAKAYLDFVSQLRNSAARKVLKAPSFSHALKDPIADDIVIASHHQVVVLEGLYANLDEGEWASAAKQYDERWVVICEERVARTRLVLRHVATGVGKDREEAKWRGGYPATVLGNNEIIDSGFASADNNDIPNGQYLLKHVLEPAIRIDSIDDNLWNVL